jgi:hypothetical protein
LRQTRVGRPAGTDHSDEGGNTEFPFFCRIVLPYEWRNQAGNRTHRFSKEWREKDAALTKEKCMRFLCSATFLILKMRHFNFNIRLCNTERFISRILFG